MDEQTQPVYLFRIRIIMDAVNKRRLQPVKMLGYRFIGKKHEIFYQLCSCISFVRPDFQGMSLFVQNNFTFREIKINSSPLLSSFSDYGRQTGHIPEHRHQFLIFFTLFRILILNYPGNAGICHSPVHMDYTFRQPVICHFAFGIHRH